MKHRMTHIGKFLITIIIILTIYLIMVTFQRLRYDPESCSCYHMTYEAKDFFEGLGLQTVRCTGNRENSSHMWLGISTSWGLLDWECAWLMFFNPHDLYKNVSVMEWK